MKAYKGFNKNMTCRDFQFTEGKKYVHEGAVSLCNSGFHACKNPLDVLHYYRLSNGTKIHEAECSGTVTDTKDDSKFACSEIRIGAEVTIAQIIKIGIGCIWERIKNTKSKEAASGYCSTGAASGYYSTGAASGDCSTGAASGYCSTGAASGYCSTGAASGRCSTGAASGDCSTAIADGKDGIAVANGYQARAKGAPGNHLVLTEYDDDMNLLHCKMAQVDGEQIKADTPYMLKNGEFTEVE